MIHFIKLFPLLFLIFFIPACQMERAVVKKQKVGDVELAYYTRGKGEPLVMVMGFRSTMAMWDPDLLNELAKHYQLILFDNRGIGMSTDTPEDKTTIRQMAADTIGLIKALGYEKVHLLGWSMGSMIGLQCAIDHPEILKSLILCSPNPGGTYQAERKTDDYLKIIKPEVSSKDAFSLSYPETAEGALAVAGLLARLAKAIELGKVPDDLVVSTITIERQVNAMRLRLQDNSIYEKLAAINVPTLVTAGLEDRLEPVENSQTVANRIPYAWSAYFPGAGHCFPSQNYLEVSQLVHIFISVAGQ